MPFLKKYLFELTLLGLIVALLIGNRLGFVYAGGSGYEAPMVFMVTEVRNGNAAFTYPRGTTLTTSADEWIQLSNGELIIWMYENTSLQFKKVDKHGVELVMPKGRIIIANNTPPERPVTVIALGQTIDVEANKPLSIINYDFLGNVDVFPVDQTTTVGAAQDFYDWYITF